MSLADIVRGGVRLAHQITRDGELQESVTLRRWRSADSYGVATYAAAVTMTAIVEHKSVRIRSRDGEEKVSTTQVLFLDPIPSLSPAVSGRTEPVDERDVITCADGTTGAILRTDGGLLDPDTTRPYLTQVYMGQG